MTVPTAERTGGLDRLGVPAVALAATLAGSCMSAAGEAEAAWADLAQVSSGTLRTATFGSTFVPVGGGTGGGTYSSASLLSPTVAYVDLRNDSSARAVLSGTVAGRSVVSLLTTTVRVDTCTTAWRRTDGTCGSVETRQLPATSLASPSPLTWATLAPGDSTHAKLSVGGGIGVAVVLLATVEAVPARPPADRTTS